MVKGEVVKLHGFGQYPLAAADIGHLSSFLVELGGRPTELAVHPIDSVGILYVNLGVPHNIPVDRTALDSSEVTLSPLDNQHEICVKRLLDGVDLGQRENLVAHTDLT